MCAGNGPSLPVFTSCQPMNIIKITTMKMIIMTHSGTTDKTLLIKSKLPLPWTSKEKTKLFEIIEVQESQ